MQCSVNSVSSVNRVSSLWDGATYIYDGIFCLGGRAFALIRPGIRDICYQRPAIWREQVEPGSRVYLAPQSQSHS